MLKNYFKLLRIEQWYKNLIIFISIIFSSNLFNTHKILWTILGFFCLCFISSSSYIINDLLDIKKDKNHPEKKNRPLVSGKIKKSTAITFSIILFVLGFSFSFFLPILFVYSVLTLFIFSQAYNFYFRNFAFLDIIFISLNFVIRAVSGTFIIDSPISLWVILCTFFLSIFLVGSKRFVELELKESDKYRPSLKNASKEVFWFLSLFSITCVFIFFSVYSILTKKPSLLISLPLALYGIFLFLQDMRTNPEKIRNPEKFLVQKKVLFTLILWVLVIIFSFYLLPN